MAKNTEKERARAVMKELASIKASNQMHAEAIQMVKANERISDEEKEDIVDKLETAIKQNNDVAQSRFNASPEEVRAVEFGEPNKAEIAKYNERLKKKGVTAEEIESKEGVNYLTAKTAKNRNESGKTRKVKTRKEIEREKAQKAEEDAMVIVRVENEDELMRQTLVKDNKEVVDNARKNTVGTRNKKKENEPVSEKTIPVADPPRATVVTKQESSDEVVSRINKMQNSYSAAFKSAPVGVSSDMIPLPSGGECYPHKMSRIRVAGLTAKQENMLVSPNMYRDGHLIDLILEDCILTEGVNVKDLCKGDRDAIVLWLRATAYGPEFPVYVTHPKTGKRYDVIAFLNEFPFKEFNLKGDENGHFTYETANGDILKFRCLTYNDDEVLKKKLASESYSLDRFSILKNLKEIRKTLDETNDFPENTISELGDYLDDMNQIVDEMSGDMPDDIQLYSKSITEKMALYTVSVNGNDDREYVQTYIENMMAGEARKYRNFVSDNIPGVDFSMRIDVPESDGGGSFDTFLRIDDTVFINV